MRDNGIMSELETELTTNEMDAAFESVLEFAMESSNQIISKEIRDKLKDDDFGIPGERKYPLYCPGDKQKTEQLIGKAIQFFHFCKPDWKEELAKNIVAAMTKNGVVVKIHPRSQIHKYVDVPNEFCSPDLKEEFKQKK